MRKVVAYARMSTDEQALSIDAQMAAIAIAAAVNGWDVVATFIDEGVSGSIDPIEREQCKLAIAMATKLKCPIVVHRLDRLGRDHGHYVALQRKLLILEADDPDGNPLLKNIKSLLSAEELVKIRQRTTDALAVLKQRAKDGDTEAQAKIARRDAGRKAAWAVGNGAAIAAKACNAAARAKVLEAELKACLYDKKKSYSAIAVCLNAKGVTTDRGSAFSAMTVSRLMSRLGLTLSA